ncbi:MAG: hypothetical protein JW807_16635 [Spirochaetes bacterium]|nr:hypothetical protein [Spirochaetota bacterium]
MKIKLRRKIARHPHRLRGVNVRRPFDDLPDDEKRRIAERIKRVTAAFDPDHQEVVNVD